MATTVTKERRHSLTAGATGAVDSADPIVKVMLTDPLWLAYREIRSMGERYTGSY